MDTAAYIEGYLHKEAVSTGAVLNVIKHALKNTFKNNISGTLAGGALGGTVGTEVEQALIEKATGSDLRPGAKTALRLGNIGRGAALGSPLGRSLLGFSPRTVKGLSMSTGGPDTILLPPNAWRAGSGFGASAGMPALAATLVHKWWPYDSKAQKEEGLNTAADNLGEFIANPVAKSADALSGSILKRLKENPDTARLVKQLGMSGDPAGLIVDKMYDKFNEKVVRPTVKEYAPDFVKTVATQLGAGTVGGGLGWLIGAGAGDLLYPDEENLKYKERRDRERRRKALKMIVSTIGTAGLMAVATGSVIPKGTINKVKGYFKPKEERS